MKIIDNLSAGSTHDARLRELLQSATSVLIASPFLMPDIGKFLSGIEMPHLEELQLVTTLAPKTEDQLRKVRSLKSLMDWAATSMPELDCTVSINNLLHGKVYIVDGEGGRVAIISSANFTESGLSVKHEWGVEIDDTQMISDLEASILGTRVRKNVTASDIDAMLAAVEAYERAHPKPASESIELDLMPLLAPLEPERAFDRSISYFLKPIGAAESPVPPTELFDEQRKRLHFSRRYPRAVHKGDILIAYGVGPRKILSIFRVEGRAQDVNQQGWKKESWMDRWPWFVWGENLTPDFGRTWNAHDLYIGTLAEQFLKAHPNEPLTAAGGRTLGALQWGVDKIRLSHAFAVYLVGRIMGHRLSSTNDSMGD